MEEIWVCLYTEKNKPVIRDSMNDYVVFLQYLRTSISLFSPSVHPRCLLGLLAKNPGQRGQEYGAKKALAQQVI